MKNLIDINITTFVIESLIIFILTLVFIRLIRDHASKLGLMDIPSERSVHKKHIARGAGIGFFAAIALVSPFFHPELFLSYFWVYVAILIVFFIGLLDDRHETAPKAKFIAIIIASILLYFNGIVIDDIGTFFGIELSLGWFALPFTIFAVVGYTNALNLIDGLDGLSASLSIVMLGAFFFIGFMHDDLFILITSLTFIVGLLAFLLYNWHPASIFMGDSGSLTLGFVISLLAIKSLDYIPAISILYLTAMPILDTIYVSIRRKIDGESMFKADKYHIHHQVATYFKYNIKLTVIVLTAFQFAYSMLALQFANTMDEGAPLVLFIVNIVIIYKVFYPHSKATREKC